MNVVDWLLAGDPAIRWQALRELTDATDDEVASERARVATEGWGAAMLAAREPDGIWAGGAHFPADFGDGGYTDQPWTATSFSLTALRTFGVDPSHPSVVDAVAHVRDKARWEYDGSRYFDGEVEPCINGQLVANGVYFGQDVTGVVRRLLDDQLDDGGWNCWTEHGATVSSAASTINVLEGLLAYERGDGPVDVAPARRRGEQYLLERSLFRRRSTGEVVDDEWLVLAYPPRWHYDVLRALEYFADVGDVPDPRVSEAVDVVRSKRDADGRWPLERVWPGAVHFELETAGEPGRWNTLRALRVLRWFDD